MKILIFMVLALVSTNVFAGEVMPQQSGVSMTDTQVFPGEPQQFAPNIEVRQPFAPVGDEAIYPDASIFVAPQHPPAGVPHTPHFVPNLPFGTPVVNSNPQVPHVSGAQTLCTSGVAPVPTGASVPQQGIIPKC